MVFALLSERWVDLLRYDNDIASKPMKLIARLERVLNCILYFHHYYNYFKCCDSFPLYFLIRIVFLNMGFLKEIRHLNQNSLYLTIQSHTVFIFTMHYFNRPALGTASQRFNNYTYKKLKYKYNVIKIHSIKMFHAQHSSK